QAVSPGHVGRPILRRAASRDGYANKNEHSRRHRRSRRRCPCRIQDLLVASCRYHSASVERVPAFCRCLTTCAIAPFICSFVHNETNLVEKPRRLLLEQINPAYPAERS